MSESAAEGGAGEALSGEQFGEVTQTAQNPGDGLWMYGFYPQNMALAASLRPRRRKRKRDR